MNPKEPLVDSNEKTESTGVADPPSSPLQSLIAERDRLQEEKAEPTDRLLRRQAEFDNFRRRAERERADVLEYANAESVRAILPILDDFERALKTHTNDKIYARG